MQEKRTARDQRLEERFVRVNYAYYARKWEGRGGKIFFLSWNWASFFFSASWLLYRRMYIPAALCLLLGNFAAQLSTTLMSYFAVFISVHMVTGLCGNSIYMNHALDTIERYRNTAESEMDAALTRRGGANLLPPILLEVLSLILLMI